jgi:hypothetical protein
MIASLLGTYQQEARGSAVELARMGEQCGSQGLGDSLGGREVHAKTDSFDGTGSGWADRGHLQASRSFLGATSGRSTRPLQSIEAAAKGFHGVGTGEEQPVEGIDAGERSIERSKAGGLNGLNGGDEDGLDPSRTEALGKFRDLMGSAGDENAVSDDSSITYLHN